jgi:hypothetical protein
VITDPYDDDEENLPTLRRRLLAPGFGEETTAVDHHALPDTGADATEAFVGVHALVSGADTEAPTPSLPLDVAETLRRLASIGGDRPAHAVDDAPTEHDVVQTSSESR